MTEEINSESSEKANSRKEEIKVGIRNALDRNQDIESAKRSLVNAGYESKIVEAAAGEINTKPKELEGKEINKKSKVKKIKQKKIKPKKIKKAKVRKEKKGHANKLPNQVIAKPKKKRAAIYVVISIIVLVLAALLGLYWDKLF